MLRELVQKLKNRLIVKLDGWTRGATSLVVPDDLRDERVVVSEMRRGYNKVTVDFLLPIKPKRAKRTKKSN